MWTQICSLDPGCLCGGFAAFLNSQTQQLSSMIAAEEWLGRLSGCHRRTHTHVHRHMYTHTSTHMQEYAQTQMWGYRTRQ